MSGNGIAGTKGFAPNPPINPRRENKYPLDHIKERAEVRRAVQEELRYKELSEKAKNNGQLSKEEKQELQYLTIVRKAEHLADVLEPKVCYLA